MRKKVSQLVSYVLHPLMMPSLTFLVVMYFLPELIKPISFITLPFLFFTTFIIPLISVSFLKFSGSISSFKMANREERIMPFSFVSLFYAMTTYMFVFKLQVNMTVALMLLSTTLLVVVLTIVTLWFKISIHAAAISGVVGNLLVFGLKYPDSLAIYPLLGGVVLAGLVMSARLQLDAHSPREILAGTFTGLLVCFNVLYWFD